MRKLYLFSGLLLLLIVSLSAHAQQTLPDSLNRIALTVSKDSAAKIYAQLAGHFLALNPDSVVTYANKALETVPKNSIAVGNAYI
jgi:hypothetical protein